MLSEEEPYAIHNNLIIKLLQPYYLHYRALAQIKDTRIHSIQKLIQQESSRHKSTF